MITYRLILILDLEKTFGLSGRTALVTGSSRGIGAAIAQGLAEAGAHVVLHGQEPSSADHKLAEILEFGGSAQSTYGDLSKKGMGRKIIEECEQLTGHLDIVIINASAQINNSLQDLKNDDLDFQINTNLRSTIEILQTCLPLMADRGWGRVVSIGSINQSSPKPVVIAYAATKAAQHNIIQSQAREYAKSGVVLNTLSPGLIDTDRNAPQKSKGQTYWKAYTQQANWMGREGQTSEMVGAAIFLSSDASSFITGEVIKLYGGC